MMALRKRVRGYLPLLGLLIVVLVGWANSFSGGFVQDNRSIVDQAKLHGFTQHNLWLIFHHTYWWPNFEGPLFRPVTDLLWLANYSLLPDPENPWGYHLVNLLLHLINTALVFALARRLLGSRARAWAAAALWALHPVQTETVTNMVGRADMLAAIAILGGLLIHLRSMETSGVRRARRLAALLAITMLGLFSKENAISLIAVIPLYEAVWYKRERLARMLWSLAATTPALLLFLWARANVVPPHWTSLIPYVDNPISGAGFWAGRVTALKVLAIYAWRLIWPVTLSPDYSWSQIPVVNSRAIAVLICFAWAIVAGSTFLLYRRRKAAFFAVWFAFLTIAPVSNVIISVGTIMGERFLYLPAFGFAILLTIAIYTGAEQVAQLLSMQSVRRLPIAAAGIILVLYGARVWVRNLDWRDDFVFWQAAVRTSPQSFRTHVAFAGELLKPAHRDFDAVIREDEIALSILKDLPPELDSPSIYLSLASNFVKIGDSFLRQRYGVTEITPESRRMYARSRELLLRRLKSAQAHPLQDNEPVLDGEQPPEDRELLGRYAEVHSYVMLSQAEILLGDKAASLRWAQDAVRTGPMRPWVWQGLYEAFFANQRRGDGMDALMTGFVLTSSSELEKKLAAEFADRGEIACAVTFEGTTPRINVSCPAVRQEACAVSPAVRAIAAKTTSRELSSRLINELENRYGCTVAALGHPVEGK